MEVTEQSTGEPHFLVEGQGSSRVIIKAKSPVRTQSLDRALKRKKEMSDEDEESFVEDELDHLLSVEGLCRAVRDMGKEVKRLREVAKEARIKELVDCSRRHTLYVKEAADFSGTIS